MAARAQRELTQGMNPNTTAYHPFPYAVSDDDRSIAAMAHLSTIIATVLSAGWLSFLGPLAVWAWKKDSNPFIRESAAGAFNFNVVLAALNAAAWVCLFTVILMPVAVLLWFGVFAAGLYFHIKAAMAARRGEVYRYPFGIALVS